MHQAKRGQAARAEATTEKKKLHDREKQYKFKECRCLRKKVPKKRQFHCAKMAKIPQQPEIRGKYACFPSLGLMVHVTSTQGQAAGSPRTLRFPTISRRRRQMMTPGNATKTSPGREACTMSSICTFTTTPGTTR